MMQLTITNADNSKMKVDLVRYFGFKTDCYLIYTLGEVDEKNYKKLYLVRIMEELGFPVVQTIRNDSDWANMQGIVKKVLKELKKNKKNLTVDLDPHQIDGIKVVDPRFFKLESSLVDILASNYAFGDNSIDANVNEMITNVDQDDTLMQTEKSIVNVQPEDDKVDTFVSNLQPSIEMVAPTPDYNDINSATNISSNVEKDIINNSDNVHTTINVEQPTISENFPVLEPIVNSSNNNNVDNPDLSNSIEIKNESNKPVAVNDSILEINSSENENLSGDTIKPIYAEVSNSSESVEIDYKSLYNSLKEDNDTTNELLDSVLIELNKYREKYGKLDANT